MSGSPKRLGIHNFEPRPENEGGPSIRIRHRPAGAAPYVFMHLAATSIPFSTKYRSVS